jgi:hypothetical protein
VLYLKGTNSVAQDRRNTKHGGSVTAWVQLLWQASGCLQVACMHRNFSLVLLCKHKKAAQRRYEFMGTSNFKHQSERKSVNET